VVVWC